MVDKLKNFKIYLYAFRTAVLIVASLFVYDILKKIEAEWNKTHPNNELKHLSQRKMIHFVTIFIIDVFILYFIAKIVEIDL